MTTAQTCHELPSDLLQRVATIAAEFPPAALRTLPEPEITAQVHRALRREGLFAMMLPRQYGGMEVPIVAAMQVWEAVARIDSSAGWNLSQAGGALLMMAKMAPAGLERILGSGQVPVFAGAAFPPGQAIEVEGGFRITAQVPFASGCRQADWLFLPAMVMAGNQPVMDAASGRPDVRMAFFPAQQVEILDTWHTLGMRGTQSADIRVTDAFVPGELVVRLGLSPDDKPNPAFSGANFRMGPWPVINGEAVAALGIAAAAIDSFVTLAATKSPPPPRLLSGAQAAAGKARCLLESARYYLHGATAKAYAAAEAGLPLSADDRISLQLANCHTAHACAQAVGLVYDAAGTSAIRQEFPLERHFRDVHVITQHMTKHTLRYVSAGRMMFGLPADVGHLL